VRTRSCHIWSADDVLHAFAIDLLRLPTVAALLTDAPVLLARALDPTATYAVVTTDGLRGDDAPANQHVDLCIPLRARGQRLGAVQVSGGRRTVFDTPLVGQVAELLTVAMLERQREAARQARALQEAAEVKFDSVSMLSHEMRTPLASIKGYATALLLDDVDWDVATRREFLQAIETEADHLTKLVADILEAGGYRVLVAHDGERALEQVALEAPDLILLDLLLPGPLDGYAVCERLRTFSMIPVIMVTARVREDEKLRGFEAGADDYVTKPFSAKELLARVQAVLRRSRTTAASPPVVEFGDITINLASQQVTSGGAPVHLTPTEYRLLMALARHPDHVMTHTELLVEVWGAEFRDEIDYLRTYVRYLRRTLEPDPANPRYLLTVPGIGYRLATT
jgi:two-component system KDP operon response regulator KdpE